MEHSILEAEIASLKKEIFELKNPNPAEAVIQLCRITGISASMLCQTFTPLAERLCNICNYSGFFKAQGARVDALCPKCGSLERHRHLMLMTQRCAIPKLKEQDVKVLHFAPEKILESTFRQFFRNYKTADLFQKADLSLNIEEINLESGSYDVVIANHVLEHVDDFKACREVSRILKRNGVFVCTVPIIEGCDETYENDAITEGRHRLLHFGQSDHLRLYGKDFRERVASGGFVLEHELTAQGEDAINYALMRGDKVFVFRKV